MNLEDYFKKRAASNKKTIVFPEGSESRIINAAHTLIKEDITDIILLGEENKINELANQNDVDLTDIQIINPAESDLKEEFTEEFFKLRQHKGISREEALEQIKKCEQTQKEFEPHDLAEQIFKSINL